VKTDIIPPLANFIEDEDTPNASDADPLKLEAPNDAKNIT